MDLPDPPAGWDGYGRTAYLLVGALSHSSKWRGVLCESTEQPQLADAQYRVAAALGGLTRDWRFDRMSTVVHPGSGKVTATYAPIAKHFGVRVRPCPPRHGNRKGVVEKANHTAAQRWWRTLPDDVTAAAAQVSLDWFCERVTDQRRRLDAGGDRCTVADLAAAERLRPVPKTPPIAVVTVARQATAQALVHYRGNRYSLPPELAGATVSVTHRVGATKLAIVTPSGVTVAVQSRRDTRCVVTMGLGSVAGIPGPRLLRTLSSRSCRDRNRCGDRRAPRGVRARRRPQRSGLHCRSPSRPS